ncbi:MAG: hypothetical protein J5818_04595 [Eggerthellaceae bacterium]|nr:hypothetical protein [Eggerthellaceae bacterium]
MPTDRAVAEPYTASTADVVEQYGIEALSDAYETAKAKAEEAASRAEEAQARVVALEADVEAQQERANTAVRNLYVMEQDKWNLYIAMLDAESFDDLVKYSDYLLHVSEANTSELNEMKGLLAQLEQEHAELEQARQEAETQEALAHEALVVLQDQRAAKQRSAYATDGADWYMTQDEFVAEWAPRINAYFAGTAMSGTGEAFARAAWRYCIDPRWSPAISCVESGKGAKCIRPYNAWGWGAADSDPQKLAATWSSWDEAIDAHVRGLARGYGYTITPRAAEVYCPPNHELWYDATSSEMAKI